MKISFENISFHKNETVVTNSVTCNSLKEFEPFALDRDKNQTELAQITRFTKEPSDLGLNCLIHV